MDINQTRIEHLVREMLEELGLPLKDENFKDTPRRVASYLLEYNQPFKIEEVLGEGFSNQDTKCLIVQSNIPFRMICAHHLLPALGVAAIGYIPNKRLVGLSKLCRLVQAVGLEKPSLQELVGERIANLLKKHIDAMGVAVVIESEHTCMACRGIATPGVRTITSSVKGVFRDVPAAREEFLSLIRKGS